MEEKINELTKREKVLNSINILKEKKNKILFIVSSTETPNASTYEIYRHATVLKNSGYDVKILTETSDYVIPYWIESELTDFIHESVENTRITIAPEDLMVIPEVFSNVMEQTKNLPCMRVGLLQSMDYMLNSLVPGTDWSVFGVNDIITTNENLKELVDEFYNKKFNINIINPAIPDYFYDNSQLKKPVVSIIGRNSNDIAKLVKLFYSKYPQFTWVTFDTMYSESNPPKPLSRKDFAKKLQGNVAAIWIDKIASFGTFPLECMASGTIPISLTPDLIPEYIYSDKTNNTHNSSCGYWSHNIYDLPNLLNKVLIETMDDEISDEYINEMEKIANKYRLSENNAVIVDVYEKFITKRLELLENGLKNIEALENNSNEKNDENE